MGRNALSLLARGLGRSLLRSVALVLLMLATGPGASWRCVSTAVEPQGRVAIFNSTGKDQIAFTADRAKLRAAFLYLPPRPLCQVTSPQGTEPQGVPKMFLDMTLEELAKEVPELKHLKSAESQDMLPMILERVGAAVADFFDNFFNTTSVEHVLFTVDSQKFEQPQHYEAKFDYLALARPGTDRTRLQEYRTDSKGKQVNVRGTVVTAGFVTLPAYFHPNYQPGSRFRYLGRDKVKGQSAYVIAFTQRPEAARQAGWVAFDDKAAFVFAQGVAWVDPARFRILRLRTDIQQPELHVGLQRETTEVEYSEVTFKQGGKTLWLPREVTVSGQTNQYTFYNEHRYSDYRLFIVQTSAKEKSP
jgi:hypothetical protein